MSQRSWIVIAIAAFFLGVLVEYAVMYPRTRQVVVNTPAPAPVVPPQPSPGNGFTGMEFDMASSTPMIVRHVVAGSGADKAGIKAGDLVVGIGNVKNPDKSAAVAVIESTKPGDSLFVTVRHGGEERTRTVVLMAFDEYRKLQAAERRGPPAP